MMGWTTLQIVGVALIWAGLADVIVAGTILKKMAEKKQDDTLAKAIPVITISGIGMTIAGVILFVLNP